MLDFFERTERAMCFAKPQPVFNRSSTNPKYCRENKRKKSVYYFKVALRSCKL